MTAPPPGLRSNLQVGSSRWAVRRAQWRALGIPDEDMTKPKIAIVNSSSKLAICFSHLDGIVPVLEEAIRAAGGLPFEVRTAAPSDFITSAGRDGRYILPSRDLIVNDVEVAVEGAQLDGMVTLASCDKTAPAHLMAAWDHWCHFLQHLPVTDALSAADEDDARHLLGEIGKLVRVRPDVV